MIILGVDPGLSGALAFMDTDSGELHIYDMPIIDREVNCADLGDIFRAHPVVDKAILEKVSAMPRQGSVSTFKFGRVYGNVEAMIAAFKIPVHKVTPSRWKKGMGLMNKDKGASRMMATEYYPKYSSSFKRVKDDGRAEAVLLARYGIDL